MQCAPKRTRIAAFKWRAGASIALIGILAGPSDARRTPPITSAALAERALSATPALRSVQRGATTIHLFGTFNRSEELILETVVPDDPREISAIAARHVTTGPLTVRGPAPLKPYFAQTHAVLASGISKAMSVD